MLLNFLNLNNIPSSKRGFTLLEYGVTKLLFNHTLKWYNLFNVLGSFFQ